MGEAGKDALRVGFDRAIRLEFHGAKVSTDAGLFTYRNLDDAVQLTESSAAELFDFRTGNNIQHSLAALLRQSIYSRLAGYEDTNDAERLSVDPVIRHVVGGRAVDRTAASTSEIGRFETDVLTHPDNLAALMNMPGQWITEGKYAVNWTRLSCHNFDDNQVRLQLFALAYNLGNVLRRLALPASVKHWTLTTLRDKLIKIGAKMVQHARYVTFQLAEAAAPSVPGDPGPAQPIRGHHRPVATGVMETEVES